MFYYPRSKAHNGKAKRVLVQRPNPAMPGTKQMPDWTCRSRWSPSDSHHAPLKASGTLTQVICDTERVWHVTAPMECLWAARETCLQETTFPNTLLWRKENNQPGFKPLFLRALRSFKVNQLITQLALKKKKIHPQIQFHWVWVKMGDPRSACFWLTACPELPGWSQPNPPGLHHRAKHAEERCKKDKPHPPPSAPKLDRFTRTRVFESQLDGHA